VLSVITCSYTSQPKSYWTPRGEFQRTLLQRSEIEQIVSPRQIDQFSDPRLAGGFNGLAALLRNLGPTFPVISTKPQPGLYFMIRCELRIMGNLAKK
jgi:hypothetical protein